IADHKINPNEELGSERPVAAAKTTGSVPASSKAQSGSGSMGMSSMAVRDVDMAAGGAPTKKSGGGGGTQPSLGGKGGMEDPGVFSGGGDGPSPRPRPACCTFQCRGMADEYPSSSCCGRQRRRSGELDGRLSRRYAHAVDDADRHAGVGCRTFEPGAF